MSAPIPTSEPTQIRAGETLSFKRSLSDYPASTWSISYSLRAKPGTQIDFTSTASGSDHLITVPFGTTALWEAGSYYGVGLVSDGTTKKEIWSGKIVVLPNLAATEEDFDPRTQARRTLDNINAVLESRASSTILDSTVEGTQLRRLSHKELLELKEKFAAIVSAEEAKADSAAGKPNKRNIYGYFS